MKTRFTELLPALWLIIVPTIPVCAQGTAAYYDAGSFYAAIQTVPGTFQSLPSFSSFPWTWGPVLTVSDVTFRGRYLSLGPNGSLFNFDSDVPLSIHFDNGARAFGPDFSSYLSPHGYSSFTATVSLDNGQSFQFPAPTDPNAQFFGFVSPTPIRDVTFSDGGVLFGGLHEELIRNVLVVTVPEPSSFGLFALGGLLLAQASVSEEVEGKSRLASLNSP